MELVIGNKNYSSWSLRAWLFLHAFGLDFDELPISLKGENVEDRLKPYSGSAKVPVLRDGDFTVWDSLAICEHVSEVYLGGQGWPARQERRTLARSAVAEMHSGFMALRNELPMNCKAKKSIDLSDAVACDVKRIEAIWSEFAEKTPGGDLRLFGSFGIADCFYAPVALRFNSYGVVLHGVANQYMHSLLQHPSMQVWINAALLETEVLPQAEI